MNVFEAEAVREVIELLVAQIGPDEVESDTDVEGAVKLLEKEIHDNATEEARAEIAVEEAEPQPA